MKTLECPSCGGSLTLKTGEYTSTCAYCGNTILFEDQKARISDAAIQKRFNDLEEHARENTRERRLSNELAILTSKLSDLQADMRTLQAANTKTAKKHLQRARQQEAVLVTRIHAIQDQLAPTGDGLADQNTVITLSGGSNRSRSTALLLAICTGFFGGHRFYTGHTLIGLIQFFTMGGFFIWTIIDIITIISGSFKDANGDVLDPTKPINGWHWKLISLFFGGMFFSGVLSANFGDNPIWFVIGFGLVYLFIYQKPVELVRKAVSKFKTTR